MTQPDMSKVDAHPRVDAVTEDDEEQVLQDLYGDPNDDGFYTGDEVNS